MIVECMCTFEQLHVDGQFEAAGLLRKSESTLRERLSLPLLQNKTILGFLFNQKLDFSGAKKLDGSLRLKT